MRFASTVCALSACSLLTLPSGAAQVATTPERISTRVELRPLALSGQQAPGLPAGSTFTFFGPIPAVGTPTLGAARLDRQGNAAFTAFATDPAAPATGTGGIWRRVGASYEPVVLHGDPAPGTSTTFHFFPSIYFGVTPQLEEGRVLFWATLEPSGSPLGIWSDRFGALELVALAGQSMPGLPGGAQIGEPDGALVAGGRVVLHAEYSVSGSASEEQEAFWRDDGPTQALVIRDNMPAPGFPAGVVFGPGNLFARGSFDDWDANASGRIAFNGFVKGPGIGLGLDEGIWAEGPAGLELVAREGAPAPGAGPDAVFLDAAGLHTFTVGGSSYHVGVRINAAGTVLFGAGLQGTGFDHGDSLWLHRGGGLSLIAKGFSGASSGNADPAPGFPAGITFGSFGTEARLNALDQVAFSAMVSSGESGIWWTRGGLVQLVARSGGPVPGLPGASFLNPGLHLGELGDSGNLLFRGAFAGPGITYANGSAMFLVDPYGQGRMLVRKGQLVDVAGDGSDLRAVDDFGAQGAFDAARGSLKLLFADGSSGLFTVHLQPLH